MSNKFRGIIYILNPFVPTIVIGTATLLLFLFWLKIEPEINAFTTSYRKVKTTIGSSTDELTRILSDTRKHLVDTVESSGIPDLITAYRAAIVGLEGLCNPQSQDTAQLPPASNDFFYPINGKPVQVRMVTAANRPVRNAGIGSDVYAANYVLRQATVGKPDYHQPPYRHVFLKLDGGTIKQKAKKLEPGLNKALKKDGSCSPHNESAMFRSRLRRNIIGRHKRRFKYTSGFGIDRADTVVLMKMC